MLYYEGNATAAAIKAGYSQKTAYSTGQENLKKPEIQQALQEKTQKKEAPHIADVEERKAILTAIARSEDKERTKAIDVLNKMDAVYLERRRDETLPTEEEANLMIVQELQVEFAKTRVCPVCGHHE